MFFAGSDKLKLCFKLKDKDATNELSNLSIVSKKCYEKGLNVMSNLLRFLFSAFIMTVLVFTGCSGTGMKEKPQNNPPTNKNTELKTSTNNSTVRTYEDIDYADNRFIFHGLKLFVSRESVEKKFGLPTANNVAPFYDNAITYGYGDFQLTFDANDTLIEINYSTNKINSMNSFKKYFNGEFYQFDDRTGSDYYYFLNPLRAQLLSIFAGPGENGGMDYSINLKAYSEGLFTEGFTLDKGLGLDVKSLNLGM